MTRQVLFSDESRWPIAGAVIGGIIGLVLLVFAVQLQSDVRSLSGEQAPDDQRFVMVNKQVNLFNTLGVQSGFSEEDIELIVAQPFVIDAVPLSSNRFQVTAFSPQLGFSTELFFESLPLRMVDLDDPEEFVWEEGNRLVPIVLSRDYLALYNFGFAPAQGLPQFTAGTIRRARFDLALQGNGLREVFQGRIVGFSDRVNSILVPQNFMNWANLRFAGSVTSRPSRIMLEAENPWSEAFQDFLKQQALEVSSGKLIGGQVAVALSLGIGIVGGLGIALIVVSGITFLLIFELMVSRAQERIRLLLELGYKPQQVSTVVVRRFALIVGSMVGLSLLLIVVLRNWQYGWMKGQGFEPTAWFSFQSVIAGLLVVAVIISVNVVSIRKLIQKLFVPQPRKTGKR